MLPKSSFFHATSTATTAAAAAAAAEAEAQSPCSASGKQALGNSYFSTSTATRRETLLLIATLEATVLALRSVCPLVARELRMREERHDQVNLPYYSPSRLR